MKRALVLLAALALAGCAADAASYDDMSSQESAVESAPAPSPEPETAPPPTSEADMRVIRDACEMKCAVGRTSCHVACGANEYWCNVNCDGDEDICRGQCQVDFPNAVGDQAPAPEESEEDMRIRQLYLACYNNCGNYYFSCLLVYCHMTSNMNCAAQANENACSCEAGCSGEQSSCWEGCSNLFNHRN